MKHGRTLVAALEQLDAAGRGDRPVDQPPADAPSHLPPLRPGAFAAWAARRDAAERPGPSRETVGRAAAGARATARPRVV